MDSGKNINYQIAFTLAAHFECVYYVDLNSGHYLVFSETVPDVTNVFPNEGDDFFIDAVKNADKFIHPDDIDRMVKSYDKETLKRELLSKNTITKTFRSVVNGEVIHMRHIVVLCKDKEHILCCLENAEAEYLENERQKKELLFAETMARRDEMTGIKNSNAFKEYVDSINLRISNEEEPEFGVVMCDVNDLKLINDTRGHAYGDETIRATSRLICEIFEHSPVFRVGGDEFVVILTDRDYIQREVLLDKLRKESNENRRSRSGPIVASGMAVFEKSDSQFSDVLQRADHLMYIDKEQLKSSRKIEGFRDMDKIDVPIPSERKRLLDAMFGALVTISGGGYIFLNDMRYDFSRWALKFIDDFGLESEYMYHADRIWQGYIHPEDRNVIKDSLDHLFKEDGELDPIKYRARRKDGTYVLLTTRGFVLTDNNGDPEYFGGIIYEV